ncbi:MAG: glutaminase, partial [Pseudomonadota bacterium]
MDLQPILDDIDAQARAAGDWGQVADYIPALARIDPAQFAIAVALPDGRCLTAGQAETRFSIQSVSKVFTLALALGRHGEGLWARVGREPTERAFNSIVQLETSGGIPRNPFVNPGAIVTTDACLAGRTPRETLGEILRFLREASGSEAVAIDPEVAASERAHGHRNFALAHFLASTGNLENSVDRAL